MSKVCKEFDNFFEQYRVLPPRRNIIFQLCFTSAHYNEK